METLQKDRYALIALGGNETSRFGPPEAMLFRTIEAFAQVSIRICALSRFFRTPAFPAGSGPDYVNAAALVETQLDPSLLMETLHRIEADSGRVRTRRWSARTLDLDLIAHGNSLLPSAAELRRWIDLPPDQQALAAPQELILPHPRLQDRAFVLVPLADVAPAWRHPLTGVTVAEMLAALPAEARAEVRPF